MNAHRNHYSPFAGALARFVSQLTGCVVLGAGLLTTLAQPAWAASPSNAKSSLLVSGWVETISSRVSGAEVSIRTLDGNEIGRSHRPTNNRGLFFIRMKGPLPAEFVAVAYGGTLGKAVLSAVVQDFNSAREELYIDPVTTIVAKMLGDHPGESLAQDESKVAGSLGMPDGYSDLSKTQLSQNPDFNSGGLQQLFGADAASNGNLQVFLNRMEDRMNSSPGVPILASASQEDTAPTAASATSSIAPRTAFATGSTTSTGSGAAVDVSSAEKAVGGIAGMDLYDVVSDMGLDLGKNLLGAAGAKAQDILLGVVFDALGLSPAAQPDPDMEELKAGMKDVQQKLALIQGELESIKANQKAYSLGTQQGFYETLEASPTIAGLKTTIRNANEKFKVISDDDPEEIAKDMSEAEALRVKYNLPSYDISENPKIQAVLSDTDQEILSQASSLVDIRDEYMRLAYECSEHMSDFNEHLMGNSDTQTEGNYVRFNRVVYKSQFFWTQASSEKVRRYFLNYDAWQVAQYEIVMEYYSAKYGFGKSAVRSLPRTAKALVQAITDKYRAQRSAQAERMAPYLNAPADFEVIDHSGSSPLVWFANPGMGPDGPLSLDFNDVRVDQMRSNGKKIGSTEYLSPPRMTHGVFGYDGNQQKMHMPNRSEISRLVAAWKPANASTRITFADWLVQQSGKGVWTEETLKARKDGVIAERYSAQKAIDDKYQRDRLLPVIGYGQAQKGMLPYWLGAAPKNDAPDAEWIRYFEGRLNVKITPRARAKVTDPIVYELPYWPSTAAQDGNRWWTTDTDVVEVPVTTTPTNLKGAPVKPWRFDTNTGEFTSDPVGYVACIKTTWGNGGSAYGQNYIYICSTSTGGKLDMINGNKAKPNFPERDGGNYVSLDSNKLSGIVISERMFHEGETYWMATSERD